MLFMHDSADHFGGMGYFGMCDVGNDGQVFSTG
jgi:hypothetical protein